MSSMNLLVSLGRHTLLNNMARVSMFYHLRFLDRTYKYPKKLCTTPIRLYNELIEPFCISW